MIEGGKGNIGHGGWEVSWLDPDAVFDGRLFLGKPSLFLTSLMRLGVPEGRVPNRVALQTSIGPRLLFWRLVFLADESCSSIRRPRKCSSKLGFRWAVRGKSSRQM